MSADFKKKLEPNLPKIIAKFSTPFFILHEDGIRQTCQRMKKCFAWNPGFANFFAVKANPLLAIIEIMLNEDFGFDCSSETELVLAQRIKANAERIMFTSNNTSSSEFEAIQKINGCIINLDDISMINKIQNTLPQLICFRYNPGARQTSGFNSIIGQPEKSKYGIPHEHIVNAYRQAQDLGITRFGLHTMVCSNQGDYKYMVQTVKMLLDVVEMISVELNIQFEFMNVGGGIGIPYKPSDDQFLLEKFAQETEKLFLEFKNKHGYMPHLYTESGRFVTGPHGVFVAQVENRMSKYQEFAGLNACCISSIMRPVMYHAEGGGYHYITIPGKDDSLTQKISIIGSACEDNDRFCWERELPIIEEGDTVIIHDTGAHNMPNNYNSRERPQTLLLRSDNTVVLIERAETINDLLQRQINLQPRILKL